MRKKNAMELESVVLSFAHEFPRVFIKYFILLSDFRHRHNVVTNRVLQ